ncbi:hypothetical protein SAMN05660226_03411 [Parapedobacter luteus]|uniref:CarboxypepD_reg-like domain-containing protein n=1 Tax=Parapedobacter luteus TaxID=623280 RepID=A0A1T5EMM0_9SPHI|nr:carboxypeptidase-like regulatory domain-containing protein [Parapedobacter luteus]SKB84920.1 hypothetical protein SAMN05660226_03411 [Parapedobacter luteus]
MINYPNHQPLLKLLSIGWAIAIASVCQAQSYLTRDISIKGGPNQRIGDLLSAVSQDQGFYFSYNSNAIAADSLVNVPNYRGPLINFLGRMLGRSYEFRETPGYVIIRYAPGTMKLAFRVEKERGRPLVIEGQVSDASNGMGVPFASIYDRQALVSTLSGPTGDFKLSIKRPGETIWLTVSKEKYRDTTLALLPPVQVGSKHKGRRYWLFLGDGSGGGLEGSAFGRFFTSSKQRIQRINLGGFFAYSSYQVSLTPGLSSQGLFNSQVVNQVSLNVLGGHTAGVNGVEIAGGFNINQQRTRYFQAAGLFNLVGNDMEGVQLAGISNIVMQKASGLQLAGVSSHASMTKGVQLSGVFNVAEDVDGMQIAGVVNTGGNVKGVQLALVNVADSSDYPIGMINLVKNGEKSVTAAVDESSMAQLAFRSGGRILYGLLGIGYYLSDSPMRYALEAGVGATALRTGAFILQAEVVSRASTDFKADIEQRLSLRLLPRVSFNQHWGFIAGPTITYTYRDKENGSLNPISGWKWYHNKDAGRALHIGMMGGVSYRW